MSIKVMDYVWEHSSQKGSGLLLLLAMADIANEDGDLYPSIARLATKSRMSERNTQLLMHKLERANEVRVFPEKGLETAKGWTNLYRIMMPGVNDSTPLNSPAVSRGTPEGYRLAYPAKENPFPEVVKLDEVKSDSPLSDGVKLVAPHVNEAHTSGGDGVKSISPEPSVITDSNSNTSMSTYLSDPAKTEEPPTAVLSLALQPANLIIGSDPDEEIRYVELDKHGNEITPSKKKTADKGKVATSKKQRNTDYEKSPHEVTAECYRAVFGAVVEYVFETDIASVNGEAGRAGIIAAWLSGKSNHLSKGGGRGKPVIVGFISKPATVEHIRMFAEHWKTENKKASIPLDPEKFVDHWRKWATKAKSASRGTGIWALNKRQSA